MSKPLKHKAAFGRGASFVLNKGTKVFGTFRRNNEIKMLVAEKKILTKIISVLYYLMDNLKVTVEQYRDIHRPYDDCDWVVVYDNDPCTIKFGRSG